MALPRCDTWPHAVKTPIRGGFAAPVLIGKISTMTGSMAGGYWIIAGVLLLGGVWAAVTIRLPPPGSVAA